MMQLSDSWKRVFTGMAVYIGVLLLLFLLYNFVYYNWEKNNIEKSLNKLENVEVVSIWGHRDFALEEITARLHIKDKGEIVLYGLSQDVFNYPKTVNLMEIGGYSFTIFKCGKITGAGPCINIGTDGMLSHLFDVEFYTVKDVVEHYDLILETFMRLKHGPELNYFHIENEEAYLLIKPKKSPDVDNLFYLMDGYRSMDYARTLNWADSTCWVR